MKERNHPREKEALGLKATFSLLRIGEGSLQDKDSPETCLAEMLPIIDATLWVRVDWRITLTGSNGGLWRANRTRLRSHHGVSGGCSGGTIGLYEQHLVQKAYAKKWEARCLRFRIARAEIRPLIALRVESASIPEMSASFLWSIFSGMKFSSVSPGKYAFQNAMTNLAWSGLPSF